MDWELGEHRVDIDYCYPPEDYAKLAELVFQWVMHCVDRYGRAEVERRYLGGLERAQHSLLGRNPGGIPPPA